MRWFRLFQPIVLASAVLAGTACYHGSRPSDIGKAAPEFTIQDGERKISLDQFRGKIVVLNFWASWCQPCVEEVASLEQMQEKLRNKEVVVVGISVDEDAGDYQKFLKDHNVNFITVRNPGERKSDGVFAPVSSKYGTYQFPETYIIDRNGIIRRKLIGAVNFNQQEILEFLTRL